MKTPDFQTMELKELYRYVLDHSRYDEAFYAYVDRSKAAGRVITIDPSDPNRWEKADAEIRKRIGNSGD